MKETNKQLNKTNQVLDFIERNTKYINAIGAGIWTAIGIMCLISKNTSNLKHALAFSSFMLSSLLIKDFMKK